MRFRAGDRVRTSQGKGTVAKVRDQIEGAAVPYCTVTVDLDKLTGASWMDFPENLEPLSLLEQLGELAWEAGDE